jgi:hypothetical protein
MVEESKKATQSVNGIGIAALVVGIVAFLSGWVAVWGLLVGITAVVLGIIALKKSKTNKGFGIAGIVLGGVAALTSVVFTIIWVLALTYVAVGSNAAIDAGKAVTNALSAQDAAAQAQIDAKKDFAKGETATFGKFTVKVVSVDTNYTPTDVYAQPTDGNKDVLVNIKVTNPNADSVDVTKYDFKLSADGVANDAEFSTVGNDFAGGSLSKGASASGNLLFSVPTSASSLKLQYETTVFAPKTYKVTNLTYTLAL